MSTYSTNYYLQTNKVNNPLIVRDDVGIAKPCCNKLPSSNFTYGKKPEPDLENAKQCTY